MCTLELKGYLSSGKVTQLLLIVDAITASDQSGESPKDMSLDKLLEQVAKQESEKEGAQEQISTNERFLKASFSIPRASVFLEDDSSAEYLPVVELQLRKTEGTFEFNSHDMGLTLSLDSTSKFLSSLSFTLHDHTLIPMYRCDRPFATER